MAIKEIPGVVAYRDQVQSHERGLEKVESLQTIAMQQCIHCSPAFSYRQPAPIMPMDREGCGSPHDLERFLHALPGEAGAQYRMPIDSSLPCLHERVELQRALQQKSVVTEVRIRRSFSHPVE